MPDHPGQGRHHLRRRPHRGQHGCDAHAVHPRHHPGRPRHHSGSQGLQDHLWQEEGRRLRRALIAERFPGRRPHCAGGGFFHGAREHAAVCVVASSLPR